MNKDTAEFARHRALGGVANDLSLPLTRLVNDFAIPGIKSAASAAFNQVVNNIKKFVVVGDVGPSRLIPGKVDGPPVLITPENTAFGAADFYSDVNSAGVALIGETISVSDQRAARMSLAALTSIGADIGRHLGLAVEETISDALEAAVYPAGQTEGTAFNVANLAAALVKYEALRTDRGGYAPAPHTLVVGPALASQLGALWPAGTGMDVVVLSTMAPGRWWIMPGVEAGIIDLDVGSLVVRETSSDTAAVSLVLNAALASAPTILTTAGGAPRFILKGGA